MRSQTLGATDTNLPSVVMLHLPPSGKLQLLVGEHVEEGDKVAVVLVALKVMSVPTHLTDHVLQAGVARKHAVGTLGREVRGLERGWRQRTALDLIVDDNVNSSIFFHGSIFIIDNQVYHEKQ